MSTFRLQLPTDPRWVNIVEKNIEEILSDHAWCEQKAATNAITIITINSEYPDLVTDMLEVAKEEMEHFQMVHDIIKKRGLKLARERKDEYVGELAQYMKKSNTGSRVSGFVERMLFSAMIEARSCERFKVLSQNIQDEELSKFYRELMESEASKLLKEEFNQLDDLNDYLRMLADMDKIGIRRKIVLIEGYIDNLKKINK
jgi:tRNA-(ms[2]io[6]A)-hydroxylase